jgi:hypothetical protein
VSKFLHYGDKTKKSSSKGFFFGKRKEGIFFFIHSKGKKHHPLLKLIHFVSMSMRKSSTGEVHLCQRENDPFQKFIPFASLSNRRIIHRKEKNDP